MVEMASNAARLIGSPLGGALLPVLGLRGLVIGDAVSFLVSAALLAGAESARTAAERASATSAGALTAITQGWHAHRASTTLMAALAISFLAAIAQGLFLVLFVLFVLRSLHAGDQLVGLLRGVQAVGGVLGGVLVGAWAKHLRARTLSCLGPGGVRAHLRAVLEQPRVHHRVLVVRHAVHRRRSSRYRAEHRPDHRHPDEPARQTYAAVSSA